jgi:hypothetical protein
MLLIRPGTRPERIGASGPDPSYSTFSGENAAILHSLTIGVRADRQEFLGG